MHVDFQKQKMDKEQFVGIQKFVAKAWKDSNTLNRLIQDPVEALKTARISVAAATVSLIPQGVPKVLVHPNGNIELEIPPAPEDVELTRLSLDLDPLDNGNGLFCKTSCC